MSTITQCSSWLLFPSPLPAPQSPCCISPGYPRSVAEPTSSVGLVAHWFLLWLHSSGIARPSMRRWRSSGRLVDCTSFRRSISSFPPAMPFARFWCSYQWRIALAFFRPIAQPACLRAADSCRSPCGPKCLALWGEGCWVAEDAELVGRALWLGRIPWQNV